MGQLARLCLLIVLLFKDVHYSVGTVKPKPIELTFGIELGLFKVQLKYFLGLHGFGLISDLNFCLVQFTLVGTKLIK